MTRILIVDDDPQLGRSLERVLEHEGHDCEVALDPVKAVQAASVFQPDALLIELQPDYVQELPQLRDALGTIPMIFMTGHREEYARLGDLVGPFDDWLAKPAAPQEFVVRIRTALRRARPGT